MSGATDGRSAMVADLQRVDVVAERTHLGGLERFLDDATVDEVMVQRGGEIWVDRGGVNVRAGSISPTALAATVERLLAPLGRRLDRLAPMVDARLPSGARLCVVIPPVAVDGMVVSIRRFHAAPLTLAHFTGPGCRALLHQIVTERCNVLVSGATSSGKTTLAGALAAGAPATERLISLEDTVELRIDHPHIVRLECRPATAEGLGEVTLGDLLRTALRLRPDRLIIGEIRGTEAVHLLQAMNTGHDGSIATLHANSAADALVRLTGLVLSGEPTWTEALVRRLIGSAVDVVVHLRRRPDGGREVSEVIELDDRGVAVRALARGNELVAPLGRGRR